jgi:hypothetical protein
MGYYLWHSLCFILGKASKASASITSQLKGAQNEFQTETGSGKLDRSDGHGKRRLHGSRF